MRAPHSNLVYTLIPLLHVGQWLGTLAECQRTSVLLLCLHGNQSQFPINTILYTGLLKCPRERVVPWKRGGSCDSLDLFRCGIPGEDPPPRNQRDPVVMMSPPGRDDVTTPVVMTSPVLMDITTGSEGFHSESHFPDLTGKPLIGKIFGRSVINWQLFCGRMGTVLLLLLLSTHDVIYGRLGQPLSTSWETRLPMRFSCRGREVYRILLNSETKTVK